MNNQEILDFLNKLTNCNWIDGRTASDDFIFYHLLPIDNTGLEDGFFKNLIELCHNK